MSLETIGKYDVVSTLGKGSMGVVYQAKDPEIGRLVAIKTLRSIFMGDDAAGNEALKRFRQESRSAGMLRHPNIVTIFEAGRTDNGTPYIVMEFIEGHSLEEIIQDRAPVHPAEAIHYLAQVASAIDYAHSHSIIHRDIKPSNVIVNDRFNPHLLDFGVAKLSDTSLTPAGTVVGTPSYMSPEQIRGERLDSSTDLFALAVVAYELLAGKRPFPGKDFTTVVNNIIHKEPLTFDEVGVDLPKDLERVLNKALSKDKSERYPTGLEFVSALAEVFSLTVDGMGLVGGYRTGMYDDKIKAASKKPAQDETTSTLVKQGNGKGDLATSAKAGGPKKLKKSKKSKKAKNAANADQVDAAATKGKAKDADSSASSSAVTTAKQKPEPSELSSSPNKTTLLVAVAVVVLGGLVFGTNLFQSADTELAVPGDNFASSSDTRERAVVDALPSDAAQVGTQSSSELLAQAREQEAEQVPLNQAGEPTGEATGEAAGQVIGQEPSEDVVPQIAGELTSEQPEQGLDGEVSTEVGASNGTQVETLATFKIPEEGLSATQLARLTDTELIELLKLVDADTSTLQLAVTEAGKRYSPELTQAVAELAQHENYQIRVSVVKVLGLANHRDRAVTVPTLTVLMDDSDFLVRGFAARTLGRIGSPEALQAITARLEIETDDRLIKVMRAQLSKAKP